MIKNECYIVGGGPSLTNFDWSQLDDKFVIAINRAYEKLPHAEIVYFTDTNWYQEHEERLLQHTGWLVKGSLRTDHKIDKNVDQFILKKPGGLCTSGGELSHGNNSTYAAINLAGIHLGFDTIYLLGIDMQHDGERSHWHNGHTRIDPETSYSKMMEHFNKLPPLLAQHKITVYNINTPKTSRLQCFPFSNQVRLSYNRNVPSEYASTYVPLPRPVQPSPPEQVPPISYRMRNAQVAQPITARQRQEAMAERKRRMAEIKKINQPNRKNR